MKVTFVAMGTEQLPISLLSAILKRDGHEVGLAFSASLFNDRFNLEIESLGKFFDDRNEVIKAIVKQQPDVLAFSPLTSTYQWMLGIAREAKQLFPNIITVWGGVHVSAVPERVLKKPEVDYVVVGEGEIAFPEILKRLETTGYTEEPIVNTRFRAKDGRIVRGVQSGFVQDLESLPAFDKSLWEEHVRIGDLWLTMASRGCPYRCTFCFNNFFAELPDDKKSRGKYVRQRSVDHMMNELLEAKRKYKIKMVDFQDDVFTVNKPWLKEFLTRYKAEINLPFQCLTHPRYIDEEVAKWLYDAGCRWIQMGVQTMDEDLKRGSLKRYESSDHIEKALTVMNRAGLLPKVDHMFGLPNEPIGAQDTAKRLYASEACPKRIQTFWTCYLPGTEMMKEAIAAGEISPEQEERLNEGLDFYFFRNEDNIKDPELVAKYRAYEVMFRLFPIMPQSWREKMEPRHVRWLPNGLSRFAASVFDVMTGFTHNNPEFAAYALHYLWHLYAFFARKVGLKPKATKVRKGYVPTPPKTKEAEYSEQERLAEAS